MAKNLNFNDVVAATAADNADKEVVIPFHWSVISVTETADGGATVVLNYHIEQRGDGLSPARGDKEYHFVPSEMSMSDLEMANRFAIPNMLKGVADERDRLNREIRVELQKAVNNKTASSEIDQAVVEAFSQEMKIAWRLEQVARLEAFVTLVNRRYVGYGIARY